MQRIAIVGTTGSGKSTLARRLAQRLACACIDQDELHWGPGWTSAPREVFRPRVAAALAGDRWTVAGNYNATRDLVWTRADTLVWLDYPLTVVLGRLAGRTLRRLLTREVLWGGNRETWRAQFLSRDSLFLWALRSHPRHQREYPAALASAEYAHLTWFRLRSPQAAAGWLRQVPAAA